ncbi:hypothetical protein BDK51DRAFT_16407, partial [Blyttiomyces helicus]
RRLYVGNLDPSVTEYRLLKLFQKHGAIAKIDYLWHKHGPRRGEPRGYCFLEYVRAESANTAVKQMHGKTISGRGMIVSLSFDHKVAPNACVRLSLR